MSKKLTWEEIKRRCRLDNEIIHMAKRLGMSPRTVMANYSSVKQEKWKTSTKDWIQTLYERRFGKHSSLRFEKHDEIINEQILLAKNFLNSNPSSVTDVYWIYATRKKGFYPKPTNRSGKWLIFEHVSKIDDLWKKIKIAVEHGKLGNNAKVSTAKLNPNAERQDIKVVCVYTSDSDDEEDVMRIREELKQLGIRKKIPYKTDQATLQGKYRKRGNKGISKYFC